MPTIQTQSTVGNILKNVVEHKKFTTGNEKFTTGNVLNATANDVTIPAGTVMARVASTNKLIVLDITATNGAQFPLFVLGQDEVIPANGNLDIQVVYTGNVVAQNIIFPTNVTLDSVVANITVRDRMNFKFDFEEGYRELFKENNF